MVAVRDTHLKTGFDLNEWMTTLDLPAADKAALFSVFEYCHNRIQDQNEQQRLSKRSAEMIGILLTLHMDMDTLKAAALFPLIEPAYMTVEQVTADFGAVISQLLQGVIDIDAIRFLQQLSSASVSDAQVDNVRRMLLAMVEDVRAVVIKLAERIACLREVKKCERRNPGAGGQGNFQHLCTAGQPSGDRTAQMGAGRSLIPLSASGYL